MDSRSISCVGFRGSCGTIPYPTQDIQLDCVQGRLGITIQEDQALAHKYIN
jgi:hypothetical protein